MRSLPLAHIRSGQRQGKGELGHTVFAGHGNIFLYPLVEGIEIYPIDIKTNGDFSSTNDKDYYFNWWAATYVV